MSTMLKTGRVTSVRKRLMFAAGLSALCAIAMPALAVDSSVTDKSTTEKSDKKVKIVASAVAAGKSAKTKKVVADAGAAGDSAKAKAATDSSTGGEKPGTVENVVVTARKREEVLTQVPISMQAFTEKTIQAAQIHNLQDIAAQSGFTFQEGISTASAGRTFGTIVFRGLQSTYGSARENSGSLFIDGIFISGGQSSVDTNDVQRIEVLKGPQNVYFGRNTFGGAVNFITKNPSDTFGGSLSADGTARGSSNLSASVEGPIIDGILSGRLTVNSYNKVAEYHTSDGGDLGAEKTNGVTGTLYATPLDGWWMRVRAHYQEDNDSAAAVGYLPGVTYGSSCAGKTFRGTDAAGNPVPVTLTQPYFCSGKIPSFGSLGAAALDQNTGLPAGFAARLNSNSLVGTVASDPFLGRVPTLNHSGLRRDVMQFSFQSGIALPENFDFNVSAGYNSSKSDTIWDVDRGLQLPNNNFYSAQPVIRTDLTLDARVSSDQSQRLRGLIGANYFNSQDEESQIDNGFFTGFVTSINTGNYINDASSVAAVYGSLDFDIFSFLTLTAEARFQHDGLTTRTRAGATLSKGYDNLLPRFILKYHPDETSSFYISYSDGTQPSIANSNYFGLNAAQQAFVNSIQPGVALFSKPPKLHTMEIGAKQTLLDGRLEYSIAGYDERWVGELTSTALFNPATCTVFLTATCPLPGSGTFLYLPGNAHIQGVEFTAQGYVIPELNLGVELDYKDAHWTKFYNSTFSGFTGGVSYFKGNSLSRLPALSGEFNATWRDHLVGEWDWYARTDVIYTGSMWESDINIAKTDAFARVNLRAGVDKGDINFELYSTNLFNDKSWNLASRVADLTNSNGGNFFGFVRQGVLVMAPDQREFGVRANVKF